MEKYYWLNKHSRLFLERGYIEEGVEPETRIRKIAENAEKYLKIDGFADKFENYMSRGFYSLSTPVWTNFGTHRGLPVSCFNSYIDDTIDSILGKTAEIGKMSKLGGGTSGYFGALRPRGAPISVGGESSGPLLFMKLFDTTAEVISQGSQRRGSFAAYLPVEHPDIEEFLRIKSEGHDIQNMSIAVTISDEWMQEMINGDKNKRRIWAAIVRKRFETGYPYIMFSDTVNNDAPQVYKDKNLKIHSSNLCVSGNTLLLTREGPFLIKTLENQEVEVWNGKQWSKTKVVKTGENQKLLRVPIGICKTHENFRTEKAVMRYSYLEVTEYHKFYLRDGSEIRAKDLKEKDVLLPFHNPFDDGWESLPYVSGPIEEIDSGDTYCVNEPLEHKAVFNGVLTGNCSEITLHSNPDESFVCVLSSLNLLHWDEIVETDAIETLIYFLDAVNEEFIIKSENLPYMKPAHNFAKNQRALGMGALGWHSFLQSKGIAFESFKAKILNSFIWKTIRERSDKASEQLAKLLGEPELLKGYGRRNVTTLAIAPTTSSSFILGQVSPSIEPLNSNYFVKKLAKGSFTYKNPYLKDLLKLKERDTDETWREILIAGGSVQGLEFLSDEEKDVFKTFDEVSQKEIIIQASQRQKYIDQSQSLNLMIPSDTKPKDVSDLLIFAWEQKVKTIYYQRSTSSTQKLSRDILSCKSCES